MIPRMTDAHGTGTAPSHNEPIPSPAETVAWPFALLTLAGGAALVAASQALWAEAPAAARALPLGAYALASAAIGAGLLQGYPHRRLGACNMVTHARATLVALLLAPLAAPWLLDHPARGWAAFALAALALALDGVDGWLARRSRLASRFGARFDVEVDAGLALLLALLAWRGGQAGAWVLLLGLPRYAFVGAGRLAPWLRAPLPERWSRKAVCALQIGALVALLAPPAGPPWTGLLAGAALAPLLWSFAVDVLWLWRRRRGPA